MSHTLSKHQTPAFTIVLAIADLNAAEWKRQWHGQYSLHLNVYHLGSHAAMHVRAVNIVLDLQ